MKMSSWASGAQIVGSGPRLGILGLRFGAPGPRTGALGPIFGAPAKGFEALGPNIGLCNGAKIEGSGRA